MTTGAASASMGQQPGSSINLNGPNAQSTGIIRLRDVVRENDYVVRLRFDAARLQRWGLSASAVVGALKPRPLFIREDPDATAANGQMLTWLATYQGVEPPAVLDLAASEVALGKAASAPHLGDLVVPG